MTSWTAGGGSNGSGACPFSFQTRNSAGQCVGCPSGTTWNNTTKKCETTRGKFPLLTAQQSAEIECKKKGGRLGAGGSPCYTLGYCHALKKEPLYDSNNLVAGCKSSGSSTGKFQLIQPTCDEWSPVCGTGGDCSRAGEGYTCQNGCCKCSDPNMWNGRNCSGKGKTISYDTWNSTRGEPSGGCPDGMKWNSDKQMCQFPLIKA